MDKVENHTKCGFPYFCLQHSPYRVSLIKRKNRQKKETTSQFWKKPMTKEIDGKLETARTNMKIALALSDLSAAEVSQKAGLSVNVLGKYLRGETMISFGNMQAVCDVIGIPMSLITSTQHITPARIKLIKAIDRMGDRELEDLMRSKS